MDLTDDASSNIRRMCVLLWSIGLYVHCSFNIFSVLLISLGDHRVLYMPETEVYVELFAVCSLAAPSFS